METGSPSGRKRCGWRVHFCKVAGVPSLVLVVACFYPRTAPESDAWSVTNRRLIALANGCREFHERAGRYPHCGMEIAAYLGDKNEEGIKDGWGNYIIFTHDALGGLGLSSIYTNSAGRAAFVEGYLEP